MYQLYWFLSYSIDAEDSKQYTEGTHGNDNYPCGYVYLHNYVWFGGF